MDCHAYILCAKICPFHNCTASQYTLFLKPKILFPYTSHSSMQLFVLSCNITSIIEYFRLPLYLAESLTDLPQITINPEGQSKC
jgi:hypothetical protein